jgi:hypothetical protein
MYLTASASLERWGTEDLLPVCWGNNDFSAGAPKAEYHDHVARWRGGASVAAVSPMLSMRVNVDAGDSTRAPPWTQL